MEPACRKKDDKSEARRNRERPAKYMVPKLTLKLTN